MRQLQSEWKDVPVVEEKNNAGCCNNMHSSKSIRFQHWQWLSSGSCFLFELWQVARVTNTAHSKNTSRVGLLCVGEWREMQLTAKPPGLSLGSFPLSHPIFSPLTADAFTAGLSKRTSETHKCYLPITLQ